jgi:N6-adenosine-specific RNA methylase IME4
MGTAIVLAQSADLDALAEEIRWHEAQANADLASALVHYAEAGARLMRVKAGLKHGRWMPWVQRELTWKMRYVDYLMEWAALVQANSQCIANLPPGTGLLAGIKAVRGGGGGRVRDADDFAQLVFSLPRDDYRIVLADPPWRYESWSGKSQDPTRRRVVEDEYATMPLEDIKALPVGEVCAPDAVLLCWATMPLLREAFEVVAAWGFEYRTAFLVWGKLNADRTPAVGFGRYTRSNGEVCLLGKRGAGVPVVPGVAVSNLLLSQREGHSQKPARQYEIIEQVFGREVPKAELFARTHMPRWDVWGLEAPAHISALDLLPQEAAG